MLTLIVLPYSTLVSPAPTPPVDAVFPIGPVDAEARVTALVWVGQPYLAPVPPPVAPVAQAAVAFSPQACIPNQGVPTVITVGVVESGIQKPVEGLIKCPLDVAVRL